MSHPDPYAGGLSRRDCQCGEAGRHDRPAVVAIVARANRALGHSGVSPAALEHEAADHVALQQLALIYAETALAKHDWIALHRYVAQLAVADRAQSLWQWEATDLMSFALADYLADHPAAGDRLLHELVAVTRQGAGDVAHDVCRHAHRALHDALCLEPACEAGREDWCETVLPRRGRRTADAHRTR